MLSGLLLAHLLAAADPAVVVPLTPDPAPAATTTETPPASTRSRGMARTIRSTANAAALLGGGALVALGGFLVVGGLGAWMVVGLLGAVAADRGGPLVLSKGSIPLPDPPERSGVRDLAISWTFTTGELAILVGLWGLTQLGWAAFNVSLGLFLWAAGAVYPQADLRGLIRFALRGVGFHALMALVALVGTAAVMGALGAPLTAVLVGLDPVAARAPLPPQAGPFLLVGAALAAASAVVLGGVGMQLVWTSTWGPRDVSL